MNKQKSTPVILIVEDDRTGLILLEECLKNEGYEVITATSGKAGFDILKENYENINVVLLDRMLPDMDGIEIARFIKSDSDMSKIPVIMQTGSDKPHQVKEGIDIGVFYYLAKPIVKTILQSVIVAAIKELKQHKLLDLEIKRHRSSFKLMTRAEFKLCTIDSANNLARFIANSFPNPRVILPGIAELLVNAVEHGICRISYEEKSKFLIEGAWNDEIDKRLALPENENKFVDVTFLKEGDKYKIIISDNGPGFDWSKYMFFDQSRALDVNGRGVARANILFDLLEYNKVGNSVTATVDNANKENLKW